MIDNLPPRRELPPEVRDRIRVRVAEGTRADAKSRKSGWAVAATVVALAGGVVAVTQVVPGPVQAPAGSANRNLDRCWAAAQQEHVTGLPDRTRWVVASVHAQGDDVVVAFTADDKPAFCEVTPSTVTMSDPAAVPARPPGQAAGVLLTTASGLVAGVTDPAWQQVELSEPDGLGVVVTGADHRTGQFAAFTGTDGTGLWIGRAKPGQETRLYPRAALPPAPPPLFTVVDRAADRSSKAGRALGDCLGRVPDAPADQAAYEPGALLEDGENSVALGRAPGHLLACTKEAGTYKLVRDAFIGQSIPVRRLSVPAVGGKVPFVGLVPSSAAKMISNFGKSRPVDVPVVAGTFARWLQPGDEVDDPADGTVWVDVDTGEGVSLFNGYVPLK
ncbi:hypothetical protein [Amycolatopsis sp. FDAARGOS 1241]|uniref:hypothetical protein n=1 Tax=Amycolatopsis sp. FDAARGOS 1241 TaxID=2778070 RepID=UPI001950BD3F|nr:hypothetical protein [Amycolatopsis sp. FDAARGOS 1241]QRP45221.1 hypothetical protein I6J71_39625 [Amycolatopsis sp. FDAARGOS 1241]